jgi:hypothetical protein
MTALVRAPVVLLMAVAVLALPASSGAAIVTIGSDLSHPANLTETHGADAVFWQTALARGGSTRIPAYGEVNTIRLKGSVVQRALTEFHFQVLRPQRNGSVTVIRSSAPFQVPVGGDPNRITTYRLIKFCAKPGDYIAFNDEGGTSPFRVFSRVPGSSTRFFTKDNGTKDGANFTGALHQGEELLMQMELSTRTDVSPGCPKHRKTRFHGVSIRRQTAPALLRKGYARIRTHCPADTFALCFGRMKLTTANGNRRKRRKLGGTRFNIGPGHTVSVRVPLTRRALRLLGGRRSLRAIAKTVVHDSYHQKKTRRARVRLKAIRG